MESSTTIVFSLPNSDAKGKKSQVAITAVARELTGFMWDIALAAQSSFSQQKQN